MLIYTILNVNMIKGDNYSDYFTLAADCETDLLNKIITFLSAVGENVIVYADTKGAYSPKNALRCSYAAFTLWVLHTAQAAVTKRPTQEAGVSRPSTCGLMCHHTPVKVEAVPPVRQTKGLLGARRRARRGVSGSTDRDATSGFILSPDWRFKR